MLKVSKTFNEIDYNPPIFNFILKTLNFLYIESFTAI